MPECPGMMDILFFRTWTEPETEENILEEEEED
jgi:hypothetical protein